MQGQVDFVLLSTFFGKTAHGAIEKWILTLGKDTDKKKQKGENLKWGTRTAIKL